MQAELPVCPGYITKVKKTTLDCLLHEGDEIVGSRQLHRFVLPHVLCVLGHTLIHTNVLVCGHDKSIMTLLK